MIKNLILISLAFFPINACTQDNILLFTGERVDKLPDLNWYGITSKRKIIPCIPTIQYVEDKENDFERNVVHSEPDLFFIFSSNRTSFSKTHTTPIHDSLRWFGHGVEINIDEDYALKGGTVQDNGNEVFSLFIERKKTKTEYEVFRNCRTITDIDSYSGCGRMPFFIDFIGDIIGDERPEILLSAETEGSILRLLLGFNNNRWSVLKWTEFE